MEKEKKQAKSAHAVRSHVKRDVGIALVALLFVIWLMMQFSANGVMTAKELNTDSTERTSVLIEEQKALLEEHKALLEEERELESRTRDALEGLTSSQKQGTVTVVGESVTSSAHASSSSPSGGPSLVDGGAGGLGSRKTLLFNHLPKAGGKYAIKVLNKHVPRDDISISREFRHTTKEDRETHFVIGNIREPCSYYLSLWHFGLQNKSGSVLLRQIQRKAFPQHPEISHIFDDGPNNLENFHTYFDIIKVCFHGTRYHMDGWSRKHEPHGSRMCDEGV